jgi:hypothetical protein
MNLATVNVIEYNHGTVTFVTSFADDKEGNVEAEALFKKIAKENGMEDSDIEICLEDGLYEDGDYQIFLTRAKKT